jgi:hypothetical protein
LVSREFLGIEEMMLGDDAWRRCAATKLMRQREHNMIRFIGGEPKYVWFSQHANGEAFAFSALQKDQSGKRVSFHTFPSRSPNHNLHNSAQLSSTNPSFKPVVYAANGSHALYATPGTHDHTLPNLNLPVPLLLVDETDAGPFYDPVPSSFCYKYTQAPTPTFAPFNNTDPTGFLNFTGRWGDDTYPDTDKRQKQLAGNKKYVGGPTGPADKQLLRKEIWPENALSKGQKIRENLAVGGSKFGEFLGKLNCFGKKAKGKRVLVSGEAVRS